MTVVIGTVEVVESGTDDVELDSEEVSDTVDVVSNEVSVTVELNNAVVELAAVEGDGVVDEDSTVEVDCAEEALEGNDVASVEVFVVLIGAVVPRVRPPYRVPLIGVMNNTAESLWLFL